MAPVAWIVFFIGLFVGSFLNVCIWRLPKSEEVVWGRSYCPSCKGKIAWYDNVPIVSFLILKGHCRKCQGNISLRYPLVELLTGFALMMVVQTWGLGWLSLVYGVLVATLIVVSVIDLREMIIPDVVSLPGLALALVVSFLLPQLHAVDGRLMALGLSALGALVGGGSIYAMGVLGELIFKKEAMGGGDVKLMAMVGAVLGWQTVLLAFFLAPIFGCVVGVPLKLKKKIELIPYGPFLSLASVVALGWKTPIFNWILGR